MPGLDIWLYGELVGRLTSKRADHLTFEPTVRATERWGNGSAILSVALPLVPGLPAPADRVRAFFNGLLPEGVGRDELTRRFNLRPRDVIGLLRELGEDCAGAVLALPEGTTPPTEQPRYHVLSDVGLAELSAQLPVAPLGMVTEPVTRKSLAGMQAKLLLTRLPSGSWAYSTNGAPSTHILKPEEPEYPGGASNEAWCMRLAKACGLTTVDAEVLHVDGTAVFSVSRYDRVVIDGKIERIHQEDMCQALGIETFDARAKYGVHNAKRMTLRAIAEVLRFHAADATEQRTRLLAMTTFHVAIGNADAHGKNHSILHHSDGKIELAPMYDAWSTIQYSRLSRTMSLSIDRTFQLEAITAARLVNEASTWGVGVSAAETAIYTTLERLGEAILREESRSELDLSEPFVASLNSRVLHLLARTDG
jgi:serine/threonine-protein kinase HipA